MNKIFTSAAAITAFVLAAAAPAIAGDSNGDFQVKLGVTGVLTQDHTKSIQIFDPAGNPFGPDLANFGGSASTNNTVIPTATLTYYLNKNLAVELFCCADKVHVNPEGILNAAGMNASLASTWVFPPILTAQYHFDGFGPLRPYVGVGFEWIHYFNSKVGSELAAGGIEKVKFKDSFGPAIQVGFDYDLGGGWSLGADVKKVWEDTKITWTDNTGATLVAKHDLDPIFVTVNLGYRFNLSDLLGRRNEPAPLK